MEVRQGGVRKRLVPTSHLGLEGGEGSGQCSLGKSGSNVLPGAGANTEDSRAATKGDGAAGIRRSAARKGRVVRRP
jgi:hypothetical protein